MKIIDLTLTLDNACMTCGTPWHEHVKLERLGRLEQVGRNTTSIHMGSHSGTHMDAPAHFFNGMFGINQIDLEQACGDVSIVNFTNKKKHSVVELSDVENIPVTARMIFVFGWFQHWKTDTYYDDFPYFSQEAVRHLIQNGMKVMALDTPSPDSVKDIGNMEDSANHKLLLKNKVILIEYLTNTDKLLVDKRYTLIALPLKIKDADGSPARVIAIEHKEGENFYEKE